MNGWYLWWLCWFVGWFTSFLAVEIYGLCTNPARTLSAAIWHLEKVQPGQPITSWTAFHFGFIGVLFVLDIWLLGHFGFKAWR